jgi:hypothetical protein
MNSNHPPTEPLFEGFAPPNPPAELRGQTLERATVALQEDPLPDLWSRIWRNRPLRLAWAATVLALIGANLATTRVPTPSSAHLAAWFPGSFAGIDEEVVEIVRLPRLQADAGSLAAALRQSAAAEDGRTAAPPARPHHKENAS